MSKEIGKFIGKIESNQDITKERIKNIKLVEFKKNDFATEQKEQIMKYQGISIIKNKKCTTWTARPTINGKQIYISGKTQKDCYNKLKHILQKTNAIEYQLKKQRAITLNQWYNEWLKLYKINQVKESTIKDYKKSLTYLNSEILNKTIQSISTIDILTNLNNIKAERQKQKVYELLCMLFDKALKNDFIEKNIMINIDKPKHEKKNSQPLSFEKEKEFIKVCKQINHGDYFLICLYQGLRKGECLAITNEDIDINNKTLTINKSINDNNQVDTTKNKQSIRTMPLFDKSIEILKKYKDIKGRIFSFSPKIQKTSLYAINKKLNFHIKTKDLRSTFITRCQESAIPEFIIQSWVGHRIGSKVTSSVYTKSNKDIDNKYIDILNNQKFD